MKIQYTPRAQRELQDAVAYYDAQSQGLGKQFEQALNDAMQTLMNWPLSGRAVSALTRKKRLGAFPYAVLYTYHEDRITIVRVVHLQSNPSYWLD